MTAPNSRKFTLGPHIVIAVSRQSLVTCQTLREESSKVRTNIEQTLSPPTVKKKALAQRHLRMAIAIFHLTDIYISSPQQKRKHEDMPNCTKSMYKVLFRSVIENQKR